MICISRSALAALALACTGLPLLAAPDITATKSDGTPAATKKNPGDTVTYTNSISNTGTLPATGVQFADPDVAGASVVANSVKVSPLAIDDSYPGTIIANTSINTNTISEFSVTANDYVGMAAGAAATITITSYSATSANGGTVSMITSGADMGKFSYSPAPGFTGTDSFNYNITNSASFSNSGSVSLTVSGPVVWFVASTGDDTSGNGTMALPFATVNKASSVDAANHKIFVASGTYNATGVTLESNEVLIGQGAVGTSFDSLAFGSTPSADTAARPAIGGTKPTLSRSSGGSTITLAQNNSIFGCSITNTGGGFAITGNSINTAQIGNSTTSDVDLGSSSASSGVLNLSGGNGSVSVNAPITTTFGRSVTIANRAGSTVSFTQAISDTAAGISLTGNTGATIAFSAGLTLNTGANAAFTATGGGTVTATQNNTSIANIITTTTGTALNVANTTIGAAGLTFRSIASNGATNGIVLSSTGTSGGLTVTGNGTDNSGGTINNTTGVGVSIANAVNVSLSRMLISNTGSHGISATGISDPNGADATPAFALLDSRLTSPGDADNENAIALGTDLAVGNNSGRFVFTNVIVEQYEEQGLSVHNNTGILTVDITGTPTGLTNSTTKFDDNNDIHGQSALLVLADQTAVINLNVTGVYFNNIEAEAVMVQSRAANSLVDVNLINNISINGGGPDNFPSGGGFAIVQDANGRANYDIKGNNIRDLQGDAIVIIADGPSEGRIGGTNGADGNIISGTLVGDGIRIDTDQLPGNGNNFTVTVLIQNNQIGSDTTFPGIGDDGIQILHRDGTKRLNLTIENNSIANTVSEALRYFQDADVSDGALNPYGAVRVAGNAMNNIGTTDAFFFQTQDTADLDLHVTGNTFPAAGNRNIILSQTGLSVFQITQASVAAMAGTNTNSTASSVGTITFNSPVTNPSLPTNPLLFAPEMISEMDAPRSTAQVIAWTETIRKQSLVPYSESDPSQPKLTASKGPNTSSEAAPAIEELTQSQLDALVAAARERWVATGLSEAQKTALNHLNFSVTNLPGWYLGEAAGTTLRIDKDAGGNGWFIDKTPLVDGEFADTQAKTLTLPPHTPASSRVDLLTTVMHEMGHALGLSDTYSHLHRSNLMYGFLSKGERRLPEAGQALGAEPHAHNEPHFLSAPIDIGTIPAGESVTIIYDVVINDPLTSFPLSSQATVTGSNFANKLTDDLASGGDPVLPGVADATVTLIERPDTTVTSLTRSATNPSNSSSVTWNIVFANAVNGLTSSNFSLANNGLGGTPAISSVTASGVAPATTWTITASTGTGSGTLGLNMANDSSLTFDVTNQPFTGEVYTIDRTPPTATIVLADSALIIGETSLVTITFSEVVTGFTNADLLVDNGTLGAVSSSDGGITWTATFTPTPNITDLTNLITLNNNGVTDAAGNAGSGTTDSNNYAIDTARPTATIVVADDNLMIGETSLVTITFSEAVTGFTNADLIADNGVLGAVSSSDGGITWTATFTPTPNITDLTNLITLNNTGVTDAAGNTGSGTTDSNNYAITSLTVSIANLAAISEGNSGTTNFTFTITRAGGATGNVSMTYTVSGVAVNAADFGGALPTNTVTIANGDTTTTVTIPVSGDTIVEPNEAFTVTLTAPDNGYVVSGAPATGIINNDDSATVSIAQVNHGAEANTPTAGKFRVTQTVASSVDTVLAYTVSGTATSGTDFTALSGIVTIPAGQTTADIDVTVLNDGTTLEPTETVVVILDGITTNNNVTLGSTLEATVNITDDDTATVTIAKIDDASEPSTNGLFRVTQSAAATVDTVLTYTVGGTATSSSDFTALSGSVTIAAGNTTADISLPMLNDAVVEATETAIVTLSNFTARDPDVSLGTTTAATVNIADNDTATVTIAKFSDGAESSTNGIFRVTQSAQSSTDTVVTYAVTGTATSGTDFTALSGSVTIPAGNTTADITVLVLDETLVEGTETVIATLNGFTAGDPQVTLGGTVAATVDITDNDSAIVTIAKMNDGAETASPTNALFRVTQSAASSTDTTLSYTIGGTATSGTDFTALIGSVTILAGNTTADISVAVLNDTVVEATETVSLTLSAISTGDPEITLGATVSASADITDNDTANVTIAKISDGAETPTSALFRVTQSAAATVDTVLTYTVGGTASGSDFTAPSGSVTIPAGNTTADISVAITNDTIVEATETISLTATAFTARDPDVSIGSPQTATADIADNDNATLAIVKQDDGAESNSPTSGSFQITQTLASSTDTVINLGVSGTAASSSDYTALPATATIPAGQTSVTLPVTVLNDNMIESTETVITSLSSLASGNTSITIGATSVATVNITDNDIANSIAVNSGSGQSATVNTAFTSPLVAVVRDSGGVALQGASVTFSAPIAGASGAFGASTTVTTNSDGLATAPAFTANTTSGSYTVSAATPGVTATASFSLTNNAGAATKYLVSAPANAIAGVPVDVTVTAQDAFNNTATAYAGTVRITSSDTAAILPANSTLTAGTRIFSVNFSTGGNQTVTATDSVISGINGTSGNVQVSPRADIVVTISDSPDPVNALGNLTYTIGVTNNGPSASADPVITLPLPASTTFVSTTATAGWTPSTPTVGANGTVTFSTATLASAASATFTVVAKVDLNVVNNSTITAIVTAAQTTADPVTANNSAQTTTTARSGADLVATLSAAPESVIAGTLLTYTLQVKNNGPLDADNAALAFTLPVGTTFVSLGSNLGWTAMTPAVGAAGTVTMSNSLFANAGDVSFPLVVKVGSNVVNDSVLNATVTASSSTIDVAPGNESASFAANVIARSDLALTVSGTPETAAKGSDVTYTLTLTNNGPSDAVNPSVSFPLPAEMTFVSAAAPLGWASTTPIIDSAGTVNFANSGLGNGEIANFTVVAKVIPTTPTGTIITAGVAAAATTADPDNADNSATFQVAVGTVNPTAVQLTTSAVLNRQTGFFDLIVNVINTTPRPINGFRLRVDFATYIAAYPSLRLYNATSAAGSSDVFVEYPYPVAVDGVVPVSLSYYTSTRTFPNPFTPNYSVEILPSSAVSGTNGAGVQPRIVLMADGNVLLEFPSVPGRWYRVRYSHDLTNWFDSTVPIQASNNRMQWIDSGAPLTVSPPSSVPSRYYRVNEIMAPPAP
jgi:uncharacterized repeat protein (TIGR01451 family)